MAQVTMELTRRWEPRSKAARWFRAMAIRHRERREVKRWLRQNPPSVGRETGAKV